MEEDNEDSDGDLSLQAADEQVYAYTVVSLLLLLGCNVFCFIIDPTNSSFYRCSVMYYITQLLACVNIKATCEFL